MQRNSLDRVLKDGQLGPQLVSLDFNSDGLQKFLESLAGAIDMLKRKVTALESEKVHIDTLTKNAEVVHNSVRLPMALTKDVVLAKTIEHPSSYDDIVTSTAGHLTNHSAVMVAINESLKKKDVRIDTLAASIGSLESAENAKQAQRKLQQTCKKYTDDELVKVLNRIKENQMTTAKKISEFENTVKDNEKKTLWKINECESSLSKRITADYVEKAMQQLESRVLNGVNGGKNQQITELRFALDTLKGKFESYTKEGDLRERETKAQIVQLQEQAKSFEKRDRIDQDQRDFDSKIKELLLKIDRLEKREDPQTLEVRISKSLAELKEKQSASIEKLNKVDEQLTSLNNVISTLGGTDGKGLDPHKLCHLDSELRKVRSSATSNESKLQSLEEEVKRSLLIFEERISATVNMLKNQDTFISREELYESMSRLRDPVNERLNEDSRLLGELNAKMTKLELFEKAIKKKMKELTRGDDLNKILDMKLNVGQAQAQFNTANMKIDNLEVLLSRLRLEVQSNSSFLKQVQDQMTNPEQGISILAPKQKVFPAKCLGCGHKHVPNVYDNSMMQGSDGRYYKVDMATYGSDKKEVFNVTPNQIAMFETSGSRIKNTGANRPTSSRTNLRPMSARRN